MCGNFLLNVKWKLPRIIILLLATKAFVGVRPLYGWLSRAVSGFALPVCYPVFKLGVA